MNAQELYERLKKNYKQEDGFKDVCKLRLPNKKDKMSEIIKQGEKNWNIHRDSIVNLNLDVELNNSK